MLDIWEPHLPLRPIYSREVVCTRELELWKSHVKDLVLLSTCRPSDAGDIGLHGQIEAARGHLNKAKRRLPCSRIQDRLQAVTSLLDGHISLNGRRRWTTVRLKRAAAAPRESTTYLESDDMQCLNRDAQVFLGHNNARRSVAELRKSFRTHYDAYLLEARRPRFGTWSPSTEFNQYLRRIRSVTDPSVSLWRRLRIADASLQWWNIMGMRMFSEEMHRRLCDMTSVKNCSVYAEICSRIWSKICVVLSSMLLR